MASPSSMEDMLNGLSSYKHSPSPPSTRREQKKWWCSFKDVCFNLSLGSKAVRITSHARLYREDPAFQNLVKNTLVQGPYVMQAGFLFKGNKLCILACPLKELLVRGARQRSLAGHFGLNKTLDILRECFHWPKLEEDVHKVVSRCSIYHKANSQFHQAFTSPF